MATIDKIRSDIEKTRAKISEQQKRLRELEQKAAEEENLEIVRMVKAVKLDNKELTAFLKAYASGLISLPADMQAELDEQEDVEDEA
jgi:septal ring factor EnvC (AmiA/AmiB activator)